MKANKTSRLTHKTKPPVKVRATSVRVRRSQVRDAISVEIEGAIRGALARVFKHREDSLPNGVEDHIVSEVETRVTSVLDEWLDFGDEP